VEEKVAIEKIRSKIRARKCCNWSRKERREGRGM
jgi:hypothetical protein